MKLSDQPFRLLAMLLERPGKLVTREELQQRLWPSQPYGEFNDGLNTAVNRLRAALDDHAETPRFIETVPKRGYRFIPLVEAESPRIETRARPIAPRRWMLLWAAVSVTVLPVAAWRFLYKRSTASTPARRVIAVLPFSNEGAGPNFDYLRYAIANDLVTDLSHVRSVTVRPFASTARYASEAADPVAVGKHLRVSDVVAGGYLLENNNLHVTMELVDVTRDATVWRTELVVSPQQLLVLGNRLAGRTTQGLLPAMNIRGASVSEMPIPTSERAFDLYLHSVAASHDPEPNLAAIEDLEKSVSLDPNYAPTWGELGRRYYIDYEYGKGGALSRAKAIAAYKNQTGLDSNSGVNVAIILAEEGELSAAYDQAATLLWRRPDSAMAHMTMGYVLRYAGLLGESAKQCKAATAIDPGNSYFRSCATVFTLLGQYDEARKYAELDENTGFGAALRMEIALRTGRRAEALAEAIAASKAGGVQYTEIVRACFGSDPQQELPPALSRMQSLETDPTLGHDSEGYYRYASVLSYCGQYDAALEQLGKAIQGGYCSYPAMESDPLFAPIRQKPKFKELEQAAIRCQQNFLARRRQVDTTLEASR